LTEVKPRASIEPTHPALIAPAGGPLAVTKKSEMRGGSPSAGQSYQLLAPRFQGTLALSADVSSRLLAGQRGTAIYRPYQQTVGMHLYHQLVRWTRSRLRHLTEEEHSPN
jgi:hypothetical protein